MKRVLYSDSMLLVFSLFQEKIDYGICQIWVVNYSP